MGPALVRQVYDHNLEMHKTWIVTLYTCAVTRAVHLDMFNAEYSIAEEFSDEYSIADVLRKIVKILLRVESENLLDPPTLEVGPID